MTVATAFAVSWKPLTNSKASAISSAQQERQQRRDRCSGGLNVLVDAVCGIAETACGDRQEGDDAAHVDGVIEFGFWIVRVGNMRVDRRCEGTHGKSPLKDGGSNPNPLTVM
jgi:hypothetical protein